MFGIGGGCDGRRRLPSGALLFSVVPVLLLLCGFFAPALATAEATSEEGEELKTVKEVVDGDSIGGGGGSVSVIQADEEVGDKEQRERKEWFERASRERILTSKSPLWRDEKLYFTLPHGYSTGRDIKDAAPQVYWYDDDKDDDDALDADYSEKGVKIAKPGNEETSTSEGFEILANILDFIRSSGESLIETKWIGKDGHPDQEEEKSNKKSKRGKKKIRKKRRKLRKKKKGSSKEKEGFLEAIRDEIKDPAFKWTYP